MLEPPTTFNAAGRPNRKPAEKTADLEYEQWRRDMIYAIYGPQEEPVKTRRGRTSA